MTRAPIGRDRERGQSIVEFAITIPLLLFILLGIVDFSRIYTTMLTIEAAAREAADFGTQYPWDWQGDPTDPSSNAAKTVQGMYDRACVASKHLTDYVGPDDTCTNPTFSYTIDPPAGVDAADCWQVAREDEPCDVIVTLAFTFNMIAPVNIPWINGGYLGFPSTLSFQRTSIFAMSDFQIDEPLAPTPTP